MDDTDGDRTATSPSGDDLTPAVKRVGGTRELGDDLTPAIRRVEDSAEDDPTIPDIEELTGEPQTLEPAIRGVWIIQSAISSAILGVIAAVAFTVFSPGGPWVGGVVFSVRSCSGSSSPSSDTASGCIRSGRTRCISNGACSRASTSLPPYVRIQHVDTRRGPIERVFGLATTVVYTAGTRGADVSIPGLTPERADDLQTRLKQLAIAAEGEDAV